MNEMTKDFYSTKLSDDEFEDMCTKIISEKYGCEFKRLGRKGQNQYGVDAISTQGIYAQYKNYRTINSRNKFLEIIKDDFITASKHYNDMQKFVVVTHLSRDTYIQQKIRELSSCIDILFWEDIENDCCTLGEKHARTVFGDIMNMCFSLYQNNTHKESEFYNYFIDLENELNDTDGYMIPIDTIKKIYRLCNLISQRNLSITFQYQPQLLQCYHDLMAIIAFFQNSNIYQNNNPFYYIIDNSKIDFSQQEVIKANFYKLKENFFSHEKVFIETIAGQVFDNNSDYDQLDLSGLS